MDTLWKRWTDYEDKLFAMGNKRNSLSKTDKDATFMRMKEDHMGDGQLKPAYNVQIGVNSEYITGVAAFSNRTDSGTLIPFLSHIQQMQGQSYRNIVADAGYESVGNYLYLETHGQTSYIKPTNYETGKTKKYREQIWRTENMEYLPHEDCYRCAAGKKLFLRRSCTEKKNGVYTSYDYYRCESCVGCPLREKCIKSENPDSPKEVKICPEFAEHRAQSLQNITTEEGVELRMNRTIQVEGSFGVLKSNRKFKRFLMRGKSNISTELFLLCLAFDLKKYAAKLQQGRLQTHLFEVKKE